MMRSPSIRWMPAKGRDKDRPVGGMGVPSGPAIGPVLVATMRDSSTSRSPCATTWATVIEALQVVAYTHLWRGEHAAGVACADAALPALEQLGHHQLRAWDAAIRAEDARLRGDVAAALRHGRAGWALAVAGGGPVSAAGALTPVIRTLCRAGRHDEAAGLTTRLAAFLD